MSKHLTYTVTLTFEDKIVSNDEIKEVGENIARALKHEADTMGLAPENSETFTKQITVSERDGIIKSFEL